MLKKLRNWHAGLSRTGKIILWSAVALGSIAAIGSTSPPPSTTSSDMSKTTTTSATASKHTPVVTTKTVTETSSIPYTSSTVSDATLAKGKTAVRTAGVNGVQTSTYQITYTDGKQTDKKLLKQEVTTEPISEVIAEGTYVAPAATVSNCDPNYSGACVPNVYPDDVDCAGGSGNGPYYVHGPLYVIGTDRYHLDSDHDNIACE